MIPKVLHRTVKCFKKLRETKMGEYRRIWEGMGVEVKDYTNNDVDNYVESFLEKQDFEAYRKVIPTTLRTDIWRLCVLYREGGVYTDIHIKPLSFLEALFDKNIDHVFVVDSMTNDKRAYNAFMMAKPGSMLIWTALQRAILHIRERIYPFNVLDITGPGVLGLVLRKALNQKDKLIEGYHRVPEGSVLIFTHVLCEVFGEQMETITYEEKPVFQCRYSDYRRDMMWIGCDSRYQNYFHHRMIYDDDLQVVKAFINTGSYHHVPISLRRIELETEMMCEYSLI